MYLQELPPRHTFNVLEPGHDLATEKRLGIDTSERMDHIHILFRVTESVKQSGCRRHCRHSPLVIPNHDRESMQPWIPDHVGDDNHPVIPGYDRESTHPWIPDHVGDDRRGSGMTNEDAGPLHYPP